MLILKKPGWALPESAATPEHLFFSRRALLGGGLAALASPTLPAFADSPYPARNNPAFTISGEPTPESISSRHNNFYEFGSHKRIARAAQALKTDPWTIRIDGMVEKPFDIGFEDLLRQFALEERLYRHRCVEAWAMAVPWTGFPLAKLIEHAQPLGGAKYVRFETFHDKDIASGQRQTWYPWPYSEGIAIDEAMNDLAFLVTGVYGKPLPKQFGAPLRLALPWKYGFKSIKSIVRVSLTDKRPVSFWEALQAEEYGFWANVNPQVPHPRWSQATEEDIATGIRRPTLLFNGYAEQVAGLYKFRSKERLWG